MRNVTEERSRIEAVFNSIRSGKSTEETRAKLKELSGVVDRSVTSSLFLDFSTSGFLDLSQLGNAAAYSKTYLDPTFKLLFQFRVHLLQAHTQETAITLYNSSISNIQIPQQDDGSL